MPVHFIYIPQLQYPGKREEKCIEGKEMRSV